jgi:hypothetical protein
MSGAAALAVEKLKPARRRSMYQTTRPNEAIPARNDGSARERFMEKVQAQLDEWSLRVDRLAAEAERLTGGAKREAQERLRHLSGKLDSAREKLRASKAARDEKWDEARAALERHWEELKSVFGGL